MSRPSINPWVAKLGYLTLWVLFLLVPITYSRTAHESFRLPKLLLSECLGLLSLLLLAVRLWTVERVDWRAFFRQPVVLAVLPALIVASLGLLTSEHPLHVREALISLWIGAACLVGWSLALTAEEHRKLLRGLILPAAVLSGLAVLQFHGWFTPFEFERNVGGRIGLTSYAGSAFDLAAYLVIPCLFLQSMLRSTSSLGWRGLLAVMAVVCGYALVVTQTLTALLAFVVGSLVLWFAWLPRRRFLAFVALIVLAALGLSLGFAPLRQRLDRKLDSLVRGDVNQVLTGRLDGWRAALWMLGQEPLTGVGHGAYRAEFGNAKEALWSEGVKFYQSQNRVYFTNAHSDVLESMAEWGWPAAGVLLWGSFLLIRCQRRLTVAEQQAVGDQPSGKQVASKQISNKKAVGKQARGKQARGKQSPGKQSLGKQNLGPQTPDERSHSELMLAGLVVLAILAWTNFPFRIALVAFPAILFISWIFAAHREVCR